MDELPAWASNLKPIYCRLQLSKHNKALRRRYYREIEKEKLRLAEEGINQEKNDWLVAFYVPFLVYVIINVMLVSVS
jgi:hypothetical protein